MLDVSVDVKDDAILKKYKLTLGHSSLANPERMPLYDEIWKMDGKTAMPGGAAMNSARATNYFLKHRK